MNDKITKKIGEAAAFAKVLEKTQADNQEVFAELLAEHVTGLAAVTATQQQALVSICEAAKTTEVLLPKIEKTAEKITKMGDMYVGDDWDDAAEVLEWLSFFVGGAIVHWELIAGAGEAMQHEDLAMVATEGVQYYEALMVQLKVAASSIGEARAV